MTLSRRACLQALAALTLLSPRAALAGSTREVRIIVVGGGVAGLTAADILTRRGAVVAVLEARGRKGGRVFTDTESFKDIPFDWGASWITSNDRNPLTPLLLSKSIAFERTRSEVLTLLGGERLSGAKRTAFDTLVTNVAAAIAGSAQRGLSLERLKPRDQQELLALSLIGPNTTGAELADMDPADFMGRVATGLDLMVKGGLGAAVTTVFNDVPVKTDMPVKAIDYDETSVRVTLRSGTVLYADGVIVTAPPALLAKGDIEITPGLPGEASEALSGLPMGSLNRIAVAFNEDIFTGIKPQTRLRAVTGVGVIDALIKPYGQPMAICTVGGKQARELERQSESTAINYALTGLSEIFGPGVAQNFIKGKATRWGLDPFAGGAIAYAKPDMTPARKTLATLQGRLRFAGEALGGPWAGTVAGAYLSGRDTAMSLWRDLNG